MMLGLLVALLVTAAYAYGVWIGGRLMYRRGFEAGQDDILRRVMV